MKKTFYTEAAYLAGIVILAFGTALMERADMGMSMVVAPAYLLHLKMSQVWGWFSFGVAEYTFQAVLLILMIVVLRKFKVSYLFSFVTAGLYGVVLDAIMLGTVHITGDILAVRISCFVIGMLLCAVGVACVFHTYIAPEVYELFVKEVSGKYGFRISLCKTIYDCVSCILAIGMSFAFFGFGVFEGVKYGTVICAICNGWIIGQIAKWMDKRFEFKDRMELRKYF